MRRLSFWLFALTVSAALAVVFLDPHWVKVDSVQLQLSKFSNEAALFERVQSALDPQLDQFKGKYFWQVSLDKIYKLVSHNRLVKRVSVYREFPSKLRVEIEPHTPVLAYLTKEGKVHPVATDATLLPPIPVHEAIDMPFLRGEQLQNELLLREKALELYSGLPDSGPIRKKQVSEIFFSEKDGFQLFVTGASAEIKVGDSDFGPKISRVEQVLSYLDSQNLKGRVIDARFSKKVVVRVRKAP